MELGSPLLGPARSGTGHTYTWTPPVGTPALSGPAVLSTYDAPSESLRYVTPWGCMLTGKRVLFRNTTRSVSPTSARSSGPSRPKCCHPGARRLTVANVESVYSRYSAFSV